MKNHYVIARPSYFAPKIHFTQLFYTFLVINVLSRVLPKYVTDVILLDHNCNKKNDCFIVFNTLFLPGR